MMHLYPTVVVKGQSFKDCKSMVMPSQSMSLQEIIQRFTRRESLPIEHEGVYIENMGDLEKIAREDVTQRHERAEHVAELIKKAKKKQADTLKVAEAKKAQEEKDRIDLEKFRASTPKPTPTPEPTESKK